MPLNKVPSYTFNSNTETGIDTIPLNSLIVDLTTGKQYILKDKTGFDVSTTLSAAIADTGKLINSGGTEGSTTVLSQPSLSADSIITEGTPLVVSITNPVTNGVYALSNISNCDAVVSGTNVTISNPTAGTCSFDVSATMVGWDGEDSLATNKAMSVKLATPTFTPPADAANSTPVTYTFTVSPSTEVLTFDVGSTDYILDAGSSSGGTSITSSVNTITVSGVNSGTVVVVLSYTADATYTNTINCTGTGYTAADTVQDIITITTGAVEGADTDVTVINTTYEASEDLNDGFTY